MGARKSGRRRGGDRQGASEGGTGEPPGRAGRGKRHTPEERRAAVEAFHKSGLTQKAFARQWDVSHVTLGAWLRKHAAEGPQGLERVASGPARRRGRAPLGRAGGPPSSRDRRNRGTPRGRWAARPRGVPRPPCPCGTRTSRDRGGRPRRRRPGDRRRRTRRCRQRVGPPARWRDRSRTGRRGAGARRERGEGPAGA